VVLIHLVTIGHSQRAVLSFVWLLLSAMAGGGVEQVSERSAHARIALDSVANRGLGGCGSRRVADQTRRAAGAGAVVPTTIASNFVEIRITLSGYLTFPRSRCC